MALLLETTLGDLVIDLDVEGGPELCKNVLKLAKARYYTSTLVYNVQANRFCQLGDPQGDGSGGACIYGLISTLLASEDGTLSNQKVLQSQQRFLKSNMGRPLTREECQEKGRVVATEMKGIADTIGSQLLITTSEGKDMALDGFKTSSAVATNGEDRQFFRSVGVVREDENNVLDKIASTYCDAEGRPYADIRVIRALVIDDPFDDPPGMAVLLKERGVVMDDDERVVSSPVYERPPEENAEIRIQADQVDPLNGEEDAEKMREQEEQVQLREDKSRAVVLEMLGDLPDAEIKAPENVLFVCKLNPVTEDEDLELIFSRFDEKVKAEIIRDNDTGSSLQYAFVEFTTKQQAVEAYFKMNNALVDDRRIKVDFSQSVAKVWNKFSQRMRNPSGNRSNQRMPKDPFSDSKRPVNRSGAPAAQHNRKSWNDQQNNVQRPNGRRFNDRENNSHRPIDNGQRRSRDKEVFDSFGRRVPPGRERPDRQEARKSGLDRDREQDDKRKRRHDSDSESRGRDPRRRRRSSSGSSERRRRKRSHKHHKSHGKRHRDDDPENDGGRSRDESGRHGERERHHHRRNSRSRKDRPESSDRSDDSSRGHPRDDRRHDDRKKHHRDDHDHRRRSDHKDRKKRHKKDDY